MNEILESIGEIHSKTDKKNLFFKGNVGIGLKSGKIETTAIMNEGNSFSLKSVSIEKKIKHQIIPKITEYGIVDYLILYLVLFVFIGLSTLACMLFT